MEGIAVIVCIGTFAMVCGLARLAAYIVERHERGNG